MILITLRLRLNGQLVARVVEVKTVNLNDNGSKINNQGRKTSRPTRDCTIPDKTPKFKINIQES